MNYILKKINDDLNKYYSSRLFGDEAFQVGWKNRQAQWNRFVQIAKVLPANRTGAFSVNDLGCGFGDFSTFLEESGFSNFTYSGYDVSDEMIAGAVKANGRRSGNSFIKIEATEEIPVADFTVASGIFNLRFSIPEHEWIYYILETISIMNDRSDKGFSFNILTRYSDENMRKKDLYYADPLFFFDFCKRNFSRNVSLLHDYDEYDFTLIVRKG